LKQNIDGERCAIKVYKKLLNFVKGKDEITYKIVLEILEEEIEHEDDLEGILVDMKMAKKLR
jgi:bacterioferritin